MIDHRKDVVPWPAGDGAPKFAESEIHVWRIELGDVDLDAAADVLDSEERERARRLRVPAAHRRFVASRAALRKILGRYVGARPETVAFSYGPAGKPRLERTAELRFNLSHSGDLALCAIRVGGEVGVDVEAIRPLRDASRLVQRHFSSGEREAWKDLRPGRRLEGFYRTWTRKEAMLKSVGLGLTYPLERVDTCGGVLAGEPCWVSALDPGPGYTAAVAADERPEGLIRWSWSEKTG